MIFNTLFKNYLKEYNINHISTVYSYFYTVYKTIILLNLLYGCETWSLNIKEGIQAKE